MLAFGWYASYLGVHTRAIIEGPVQAQGTVSNITSVPRSFDELTIDETSYDKPIIFWRVSKGAQIRFVHDPVEHYAFPADQIELSSLSIVCLTLALPLNLMILLISLFGYIAFFQMWKKCPSKNSNDLAMPN